MSAVFDTPFPEIEEAPAPAVQPAAVEQTRAITASITVVQGEVAKFDQIAAGLKAIETAHPKNVIVAAIDTPAGMKVAEAAWRAYRNPRLEVERARKAAKAPVLALGKAIDTFAGSLEDRLREGETHYKAQIDREEERKEAARAEAARIEAEKAAAHAARLAVIAGYVSRCQAPGMTAERIQNGINALAGVDPADPVQDRAEELAAAQTKALDAMRALHAQAVGREAEAARQEAIRLENERMAAELAQARAALEAEAAAVRAQAAELDRQRREAEAKEAARVKAEADAADAAEAIHQAELHAASLRAEAAAMTAQAQAQANETTEAQPPQQVLKAEPATADATDRGTAATVSPRGGAMGVGQAAAAAPAGAVDEPATLKLGDICARLAPIKLDAAGLAELGISPVKNEGAAKLYRESDFARALRAIAKHIEALQVVPA
jgi:hypothetical protein